MRRIKQRKKSNKYFKWAIALLIIIALELFILFLLYNQRNVSYELPRIFKNLTNYNVEYDYKKCNTGKIIIDASCFNRYVNSFYNYNISNLGKALSFETLKTEGGVCRHYTDVYNQAASEMGYITKDIGIKYKNMSHVFSLIYNEDGYCVMDQASYYCFGFKKE